jgi:pimeloyl-ACP methyl ester carboxylesterase
LAPLLHLECGRAVSYRSYGAADGAPVIALHGTPGSHLKFAAAAEAAGGLGLRLIALDRWCYGQTEAPGDPRLTTFADDVRQIADTLGFDRFAVVGISGGGPFAAAVAAELGSRVSALALVAPVGPIHGVTPAPKLGPAHHATFRILPHIPGVLPTAFRALRRVAGRSPRLATRLAAGLARGADRAIARDPDFADSLGRTFAVGLASSVWGPVIDLQLFARSWDVALGATVAPAHIWIGDQDRNVPLAAVDALARELGRNACAVTVTRLSGHGHFWIALNYGQVLSWIAGIGN